VAHIHPSRVCHRCALAPAVRKYCAACSPIAAKETHNRTTAACQRRQYRERRAQRVCTTCRTPTAFSTCLACRQAQRAIRRDRYREDTGVRDRLKASARQEYTRRRAAGRCCCCGKEADGRARCMECHLAANVRRQQRRAEQACRKARKAVTDQQRRTRLRETA
jgi:hypothetical protein